MWLGSPGAWGRGSAERVAGLVWPGDGGFRRDLTIRHLVDRLNTDDAGTESATLETRLQLPLCLTRSHDQNGFRITDGSLPRS